MKGFAGIIAVFVGLTLAIILAANVVIPTVTNANTSGWPYGATAMWGILPLVIIAGILLMMFR